MLAGDEEYGYLSTEAVAVLADRRVELGCVLAPGRSGIQTADGEIRWWTFAGGRINSTLRYALGTALPGVQIIPDNFLLRLRGEDLTSPQFEEALVRLRTPLFWNDEDLWDGVLDSLPNYRLSKFQPLMPPWVEREVIANYLLDVDGARTWLETHRSRRS